MLTQTSSEIPSALADIVDVKPLQVSSQASLAAIITQIGQAREACTQTASDVIASVNNTAGKSKGKESLFNTDYSIVVFAGVQPVGLLTSQDLIGCLALEINLSRTQVQAIMGPMPPQIQADASLEAAYQLMQQHQVQQLAVCDSQKQLLGLVTQRALLQSLHRSRLTMPSPEVALTEPFPPHTETDRLCIQVRQQTALAALGQRAIAAQDADKFMTMAARLTARILDVKYCPIWELLPGRDALLLRTGVGWRPGLVEQVIVGTEHNSQAGYTLLSSEPVVVEDLATETRFESTDLLLDHGIVSGVSITIPRRTRPFGVLCVYTTHHRHFSSDDVHFLQAIANILAAVIERQAVERANQFQAHLLSHVTDAVIAIDNDRRITYWNPAAEQLYGLGASEVYGSRITDCFDYSWLSPADKQAAKTAIKTHSRWQGEQIHRLQNGEERCVEASISILKDEGGNASGMIATIRDISDRYRARVDRHRSINVSDYQRTEAQLRQSEATLAKAQEIAHIGSWEFDLVTQTLNCSAEMFRLFGLDPSSSPPNLRQIAQFFPPEDWTQVQQAARQLMATGEPQPFAGHIARPNGELRYLEGSSEAVKNDQGEVVKLLGTAMDVTERKQRQDQLQLLESVILHANDAVLITEADRIDLPGPRIVYANPAFTAMTGYANAEVIGQSPRILQGPNTDRDSLDQIRTALKTHQKIRIELVNYRKDGSEFWVEMELVPITNSTGQVTHFVAIQRDVSDRKRNDQMLKEQAELINIATDAFLVRDLDNRLLFWSRGAEHIYGWRAEEVLGRNVASLLDPKTPLQVQEAWQTVLNLGEWQGKVLKHTKAKDIRTIESRWTLVRDSAGHPKAVLSVDTDITERKQLEAQFLRTQRLESLGTLASGIAHDLNNILTPILGVAQILSHQLQDAKPSTLDLINILRTSAKRGAALSKQILAFAQGTESDFTVLNMRYLLSEVKRFVQKTFPKSIVIRLSVPKDLWMLMGDATHLYQVFMNLCVNARDAMPNGGILSLSAQNVYLDETSCRPHPDLNSGPYVVIEVADTGTGIAPECIDKIFDPFFTTKEPDKGTGLGLSTAANIIKRHNGQIQVASQLNQGACFTVYLPAAQIEAPSPAATGDLPRGSGELILVVDDELQICQVTKVLLENHNYRVLTARNGAEAITLGEAHAPEINGVLMDMRMPKMSGMIALEALQRINPQLKVVVTSGVMSTDEFISRDDLKGHTLLPKPYSVEDLLQAIYVALNG